MSTLNLSAGSKAKIREFVSSRQKKKNDGGVLGGVGYLGASLASGVGLVGEGVIDVVTAVTDVIRGDTEAAENRFKENVVGDWYADVTKDYNPSGAMKFAGDVTHGIGQSSVFLLDAVAPGLGTGLFFGGTAGQGISSAAEKTGKVGLSEIGYGLGSAALETAVGKVVGAGGQAAKSLGTSLAKKGTSSALKGIGKTAGGTALKNIGKEVGKEALGEFAEEALSEAADPLLQRVTGVDRDAEWASLGDILYAGTVGAVSGGVMGSAPAVINYRDAKSTGAKVRRDGKLAELLGRADMVAGTLGTASETLKADSRLKFESDAEGLSRAGARVGHFVTNRTDRKQSKRTAKYADDLAKSIEAVRGLSEDVLSSGRGDAAIGELQRSLLFVNISQKIDAREMQMRTAEDAEIQAYVDLVNRKAAETKQAKTDYRYTVEDFRNNRDLIATQLAAASFADEMVMSSRKAAREAQAVKAEQAGENATGTDEAAEDVTAKTAADATAVAVTPENAPGRVKASGQADVGESAQTGAETNTEATAGGSARISSAVQEALGAMTELGQTGVPFQTALVQAGQLRAGNPILTDSERNALYDAWHTGKMAPRGTSMSEIEAVGGFGVQNAKESTLVSAAAGQGIPAKSIPAMLNAYRKGTVLNPEAFAQGWAQAVLLTGRYKLRSTSADSALGKMETEHRLAATEMGRAYAAEDAAKRVKEADKKKAPSVKKGAQVGKVRVQNSIILSKLSDEQYTAYKAAEIMAEALGTDIYIRTDMPAKENGYYDLKTDTIHINIGAVRDGKQIALYTLGHEATHYIREWSPQKFAVLSDFVMDRLGKDAETAIGEKLERLRKAGLVSGMTVQDAYDLAHEEVVADGMEAVLTDGKVLEELSRTDKSLWEKVKGWITKIISKIRKVYGKLDGASETAKALSETVESLNEIERLFVEGVMEAGERRKTAPEARMDEEKMYISRGVKYSSQESIDTELLDFYYSVMSMKDKNAISKRKKNLGKISENHARLVSETIKKETGKTLNVSGYELWIDGSAIQHIEDKHGRNGSSDHSMEDPNDVARIEWAANYAESSRMARTQSGDIDYSTHFKNKDGSPSPKILLEKSIGDGNLIVAECVPNTNARSIHVVSARIEKGGRGQVLNVESSDSPQPTSETPLDSNATKDSIPQNGDSVKRKFSLNEDTAENAAVGRNGDGGKAVSLRERLVEMLDSMVETDADYQILTKYAKQIDDLDAMQERMDELSARRAELQDMQFNALNATERSEAARKLQAVYKEIGKLSESMAKGDGELSRLGEMAPIRNLMKQAEKKGARRAEKKAEKRINKMRVRHDAKFKAVKNEAKAIIKGQQKRRELTVRQRVTRRTIAQLHTLVYAPTKEKHVPAEMQEVMERILSHANVEGFGEVRKRMAALSELEREMDKLERIPVRNGRQQARLDILSERYAALGDAALNAKEQVEALLEAYETFGEFEDGVCKGAYDEVIAERLRDDLKKIEKVPLSEMGVESLAAIEDFYKLLYHRINTANRLFTEERTATYEKTGHTIMEELQAAKELKLFQPKVGEPAAISAVRRYAWQMMKPITAFDVLGSDTYSRIFYKLRCGEDVFARDVNEAQAKFDALAEQYHFFNWDRESRHEFVTSNGKRVKLTLGQMMSLYAYSRRKDSHLHLRKGGFTFPPNATYDGKMFDKEDVHKFGIKLKRMIGDSERYTLTEVEFEKIASQLTEEQRAFADAMQEYLSVDMAAKGNEVSVKLYGCKLFLEKFYWPMKSAKDYIDSEIGKVGDPKIKNKGMTKQTVPGARNPLVLQDFMELWTGHVNEMALYHGMVLPMEDMNRLLNYRPGGDLSQAEAEVAFANATVNRNVLDLLDRVKKGTSKDNDKVYLENMSTEVAKRIQEITGVDVTGFKVAIEARQLEHILKDHGENGKTDQSMRSDDTIAKIEYALKKPDNISPSGKTQAYSYMRDGHNRTADTVLYQKNIGEKTYFVVQAVPDTKAKTLYIVTAYVGKSSNKKGPPQLIDAQSPNATSKNGFAGVPKNSIAQNPEKSNPKFENHLTDIDKHSTMKALIHKKYGAEAVQYIEQLLRDLNGGARGGAPTGLVDRGISLFKKSAVTASASVVIQQPSSIVRAMALIHPKYFGNFAGVDFKNSRAIYEELKKHAPVAVIKEMSGFDTGVGQATDDYIMERDYALKKKPGAFLKDKAYRDRVLGYGAAKADQMAWLHLWEACKREQHALHPKMDVKSEDFLKLAGERFTEVVVRTQVYDSTLSRSAMMRSKDTGWKMATAFMAEPTTVVNMLASAAVKLQRGDKKAFRKTVGSVVGALVLNAVLASIVYAARDDDEEKNYGEKYVSSLVSETADAFNPLTVLPYVKDIWSLVQGYDVERTDVAVFADLIQSVNGMASDEKTWLEKTINLGANAGTLFGLPTRNIQRDARGIYRVMTGAGGDGSTSAGYGYAAKESFNRLIPFGKLFGVKTDIPNGYQLYEAAIKSDRTHYNRVAARYEDADAAEQALRTALRDNDRRISEAAEARLEGDMSEYKAILSEIESEGHFGRDMIVRAVNSEINAINRDANQATAAADISDISDILSDETESLYTVADYRRELEAGDTDGAREVYDEIVAAKVAGGSTERAAKAAVKSSVTAYYKNLYLAARQNGDKTEMARIRQTMLSGGLYGKSSAVSEVIQGWIKSALNKSV